ncbi:MAG: MBL fold metallo-hydrolase [Chloroflexi bacterium]|nr:MBL fold metallo-hydrolase [Chloroflexota bacterium]
MSQVILLGTGAALSDEHREHTFMVVTGAKGSILIDCGGAPIARLITAKVSLDSIDHLILTHHHPDHIYGLSVFLLDLWLAGRKKTLHIHGLAETLRAARAMMHAFEWERWLQFGFFPVEFHRISKKSRLPIFETSDFSVTTTMTKHLLPTVATRILSKSSGKVIVYSSDTEMYEPVAELAQGADILFHESTSLIESHLGHSSALQAGIQAQCADVRKLVLVHLPPHVDAKKAHAAAKKNFKRQVVVGKDFQRFEF